MFSYLKKNIPHIEQLYLLSEKKNSKWSNITNGDFFISITKNEIILQNYVYWFKNQKSSMNNIFFLPKI
jgi:hypothetical protein